MHGFQPALNVRFRFIAFSDVLEVFEIAVDVEEDPEEVHRHRRRMLQTAQSASNFIGIQLRSLSRVARLI